MGACMYCISDPFSCPYSELYRLLHDCETESSDAEIKIKNTVEKENLASLTARLETVFFLHHRYDAQSIKES